jgi:hypothetical protein
MEISKDYSWVILAGLAINFHALKQAGSIGKIRRQIFPIEFMEK